MAYRIENPATGEVEKQWQNQSDNEVSDAIARADAAYQQWRQRPVQERADVLRKVADLYTEREDELAEAVTREMGKPIAQAHSELQLVASIYRWYADNGPELMQEETLEIGDAPKSVVVTEPVGVLVGVMPWNFPHYQVARFVAPNLMLGNTMLLKHASICASSALLMEQLLHDAGVPQDAYINLFVSSDQITDIISDPRIQGVSLTGSEGAGAAVAETAGKHLKKSVLELGGSDALIVLDTPDVQKMARNVLKARMSNVGQACNSPKRVLVPSSIFDEFVEATLTAAKALKVGDPMDESMDVGPLSSVEARDDVVKQINTAVEQGATLRQGGHAMDKPGAFLEPTVLTGVTKNMDAYGEEIFGPVEVIYPYETVEDAVQLANDSSFGLSGSVWSSDTDKAEQVARQLNVGMAYVNEHGTTLPGLPFGGVQRSGYGRELGKWGMAEFANRKLVRVTTK